MVGDRAFSYGLAGMEWGYMSYDIREPGEMWYTMLPLLHARPLCSVATIQAPVVHSQRP